MTVKILTGDNEIITRKICREVKLEPGEIVLGGQIEQMDEDELADAADRTTVFAKLTPAQKERIIRALAPQGPRGRLSRRRHQRQPGA